MFINIYVLFYFSFISNQKNKLEINDCQIKLNIFIIKQKYSIKNINILFV